MGQLVEGGQAPGNKSQTPITKSQTQNPTETEKENREDKERISGEEEEKWIRKEEGEIELGKKRKRWNDTDICERNGQEV